RGTQRPLPRAQRARRSRLARAAAPAQPAPTRWAPAVRAAASPRFAPRRSRSSTTRRPRPSGSSLQLGPQLPEAARDAARDRPGRQLERVADRPVALVAAEEALEDLPARVADRLQGGAHRQRLVQRRQGLVHPRRLEIVELRGPFAPAAAQAVDAEPPRQLA